jgi:hypothetical protein
MLLAAKDQQGKKGASRRSAVAKRTPSQRTEHAAALRTQPPKVESLT